MLLSTLRSYIGALQRKGRLLVDFDGEEIEIDLGPIRALAPIDSSRRDRPVAIHSAARYVRACKLAEKPQVTAS
jgi:hypothetical protein